MLMVKHDLLKSDISMSCSFMGFSPVVKEKKKKKECLFKMYTKNAVKGDWKC